MSQELLYTSAPTGLKSGSRGFATVLCTAGMASNISTRLETLSGYRHVFSPQDPQASLNPVSWSHLRLTINGQPTSILSRIAAYGVDYSGRTNKLAHHVVPTPAELAKAGPAWMLLQSSWVRSDWDGNCQTPASGPALPSGNQPVEVCQRWQQTTGDAGWGGVLAETISSPGSKPLWIVFSIDQSASLLILINESIALMPVSQRWRATFSTYYTNLPPEIDCKIRCVLVGTEEAKLAPARGTVIDLTKTLTPAPDSAYVETARTGVVMAKAITPVPASPGVHPRSSTSSPLEVIDGDSLWPEEISLQPPAVLGKPPGLAMVNQPNLPPQLPAGALSVGDKGRRRRIGWAIGISALAIILLLSAAIPVILAMKKHSDGIAELAANGTNTEQNKQGQNKSVEKQVVNISASSMPGVDPANPADSPLVPTKAPDQVDPSIESSNPVNTEEPRGAATASAPKPPLGDEMTDPTGASDGVEMRGVAISSSSTSDATPSSQAADDDGDGQANSSGETKDSDVRKGVQNPIDGAAEETNSPKVFVVISTVDVDTMFKKKSLQATFSFNPESNGVAFWRSGADPKPPSNVNDYYDFNNEHEIETKLGRVGLTFKSMDGTPAIRGEVKFKDFKSSEHFAGHIGWCNGMEMLHKDFTVIVDAYTKQFIAFSSLPKNPGRLKVPKDDFFSKFETATRIADSLRTDVNKHISAPPKSIAISSHGEFIALAGGFVMLTDKFLTTANSGILKRGETLVSEIPEVDFGEIVLYTNSQAGNLKPGTSIVLKLKLTVKE